MIVEWKIPDEELPIVEPTGIDGLMKSCTEQGLFVNAWMPMIPPYRED